MASPETLRQVIIAAFTLPAGILCALATRHLVSDLRQIIRWSLGSLGFIMVGATIGLVGALTGDPSLPFYERLTTIVGLFLFVSVVPHIRTHICVRCSVGDEHVA